jgi:hypothetical protein
MALPFTDNFNDGDLTNWTTLTSSDAWTNPGTVAQCNISGALACMYVSSESPSADQYAQAVLAQDIESVDATFGCGVAVRCSTSAKTCYLAYCNTVASGEVCLAKYVAGTRTEITSDNTGATPALGDVLRLEVEGTALRVYLNGNLRISTTDASIATGNFGIAGTVFNDFPIGVDDFEGGNLVTTAFYFSNPVIGGGSAGTLALTAPTASTSTTGWIVGTTVANRYSRQTYNSEIAAANFTSTAQPSGAPTGSAQDCWRLSTATSLLFSSGTWYSSLSVIAVTSGGIQDGRARFRLWRSANADGTSATELTQGTMIGTTVTNLSTTVAQSSSASTFIAASNLTSEFLFAQVAWETL